MIDLKRPVKVKDGRKARIVCRDARGSYPVIALIEHYKSGFEEVQCYTLNGQKYVGRETDEDLVNIDETEYLLSNPVNSKRLIDAAKDMQNNI